MASPSRRASFQRLFRAHFDYVWRVALREVGELHADDVTQETFIVAHRRFTEFDGTRAKAWLYAIVRNVASGHRRSEGRQQRRRLRAVEDEVPTPGVEGSLEVGLEVERAAAVMEEFLSGLPAAQAEAFALAKIESLTASEVAQVQGVPRRTVFSRIRLAQTKFERFIMRRSRGVSSHG